METTALFLEVDITEGPDGLMFSSDVLVTLGAKTDRASLSLRRR